jgi:hypothetical protein
MDKIETKKTTIPRNKKIQKFPIQLSAACLFPGCFFITSTDLLLLRHQMKEHMCQTTFKCLYPECQANPDRPVTNDPRAKGRAYANLDRLRRHARTHFIKPKYQCRLCSHVAHNRPNFIRHKIHHEGIKPFVCGVNGCTVAFTQTSSRNTHRKKFHSEKPNLHNSINDEIKGTSDNNMNVHKEDAADSII